MTECNNCRGLTTSRGDTPPCLACGREIPLAAAAYHPGLRPDNIWMPRALTAENGAKAVMLGEFFVKTSEPCEFCDGYSTCNVCEDTGRAWVRVSISWSTIKAIYAKAVELFSS